MPIAAAPTIVEHLEEATKVRTSQSGKRQAKEANRFCIGEWTLRLSIWLILSVTEDRFLLKFFQKLTQTNTELTNNAATSYHSYDEDAIF